MTAFVHGGRHSRPLRDRPRNFARRLRSTTLIVVSLALVTTSLVLPSAAQAATTQAAAAGSTYLPFDMPSTATLRASGKKVFAHYVPWFPLSFDNKDASVDYYTKNYIAINGEGGKYAQYGGKQRDRPFTRAPINDVNWQLRDMETEVRQAISGGIDGFVVSIVSFGDTQTWNATKTLMQAAKNVDPGFKIMLRPNMISPGIKDQSAATVAKNLAELAAFTSAYRLADNSLVLSPFRAEVDTIAWWQGLFALMKTTYGITVAFWPMFLNEIQWGPTFAPISYGMANWGDRTAAFNNPLSTSATSDINRGKTVQARGDKWMAPVSLQDARPTQSIYYEAQNTLNLRNTWKIAIDGNADMVHIPTWNDYAEGSQIAPSAKIGWASLDINAYYLTWYKTGKAPTIVRDMVYLSHRLMSTTAKPTSQPTMMKLLAGTTATNNVEVLTFLKAAGTVTIGVGAKNYTCAVDAGVDTCTVPLGTGKISAKVVRGGVTVAGTTSPHTVTATPTVQDMDYVSASSGRTPTAGPTGTTTTAPATPVAQTVSVTASADTYVNSLAATKTSGSITSVVSDGSPAVATYLRFNVPAPPAGTKLTKAALKIWVATNADAGSASSHSITAASNTWDEATMNWNNRPALSGAAVGTITGATKLDSPVEATVALSALAVTATTAKTFAVTSAGSDDLRFWSSEFAAGDRRPQLVLTYA
jgi:hypothetical protein